MKKKEKLQVHIVSFGFKYGAPANANFIWDVRFLPNPYWEEELRSKTGLENEVSDYVVASPAGHSFIKLLKPMLFFLVQQNITADKEDITIAVGCTGGRHRSVAVAEVLHDMLKMMPVGVSIDHRDIGKES